MTQITSEPEIITALRGLGVETAFVSNTKGGEYHGPCPFCGGDDRFSIRPFDPESRQGFYACRKCKAYGNLNQLQAKLSGSASDSQLNTTWTNTCYSASASPKSPGKSLKAPAPPSLEWQKAVRRFLGYQFKRKHRFELLARRGINRKTAERFKLCVSFASEELHIDEPIYIPAGLLIPNYRGDTLYGTRVRPWQGRSKYIYVKGSTAVPMIVTTLNDLQAPVIIVESELDACLINQEVGDMFHAVAMCSVQSKPDLLTHRLLLQAREIFVCLDHDEHGLEAWGWWQDCYPRAHQIFPPSCKDVGEFHLKEGRTREWLLDTISAAERNLPLPARPKPSFKVYLVKEPKEVQEVVATLQKSGEPVGFCIRGRKKDSQSEDPGLTNPKLLALATGSVSYVIDLAKVRSGDLADLEQCRLAAFNAPHQMAQLQALGLHHNNVGSIDLQWFLLHHGDKPELEAMEQHFMGYGSAHHSADFTRKVYSNSEWLAAATDAFAIGRIFQIQQRLLQESNHAQLCDLFAGAFPASAQIMAHGLPFDWPAHQRAIERWKHELEETAPEDEKRHKSITSMLRTWGEALCNRQSPRTGRIHPLISLPGTVTGRAASTSPNIQGMPKDASLRECVRAPEGRVLVCADYSQLDLRVAANVSGDAGLLRAFESGKDIHRETAAKIKGIPLDEVTAEQRKTAKIAIYSSLYSFRSNGNAVSRAFSEQYPVLHQWRVTQKNKYGSLSLTTTSGRIIQQDFKKDWGNCLINYPIQAGSAEVMLAALGRLQTELAGLDAHVVNWVHDEILLEAAHEHAEQVKTALEKAMIDGFLQIFPAAPVTGLVEAKIGATWQDVK